MHLDSIWGTGHNTFTTDAQPLNVLAVRCHGMRGSQYARRIEREKELFSVEHPHCFTGMMSTDHLDILVVAFWWNRKATIELSKIELQGSRAYQGFGSAAWHLRNHSSGNNILSSDVNLLGKGKKSYEDGQTVFPQGNKYHSRSGHNRLQYQLIYQQ